MADVLFVCSGNTCRSPMAACLFNAECEKRGLPYRAASAGAAACEGMPASDGAYTVMKERGLSLASHRSQPLSEQALQGVRLVVCMSASHAWAVRERFPTANVAVMQPSISDPYGGTVVRYRQTADELALQMDAVIARLREASN